MGQPSLYNQAMSVHPFFQPLYDWGITVIQAFQSVDSPILAVLALAITFLGDPLFYLMAMPVVYWCVDSRFGFRLAVVTLVNGAFTTALKDLWRVPRPEGVVPGIARVHESSWATPSGHAQGSAGFWPLLALGRPQATRLAGAGLGGAGSDAAPGATHGTSQSSAGSSPVHHHGWRAWAVALGLPFLIGLSRIWLGVHYPSDVLLGWVLGSAVSVLALLVLPRVEAALTTRLTRFTGAGSGAGQGRALAFGTTTLVGGLLILLNLEDLSMPGAFLGFVLGHLAAGMTGVRLDAAAGTGRQKAGRLVLGLGLLAVVYFGLKAVFPGAEEPYGQGFRFVRYALVGLSGAWLAPALFRLVGLGGDKPAAPGKGPGTRADTGVITAAGASTPAGASGTGGGTAPRAAAGPPSLVHLPGESKPVKDASRQTRSRTAPSAQSARPDHTRRPFRILRGLAWILGGLVLVLLIIDLQPYAPGPAGTNALRRAPDAPVRTIPHGGAKLLFPENTRYAWRKMYEAGWTTFEVDLCLSKDGVLMSHHDIDLGDSAGLPGTRIGDLSAAELEALSLWPAFRDPAGQPPDAAPGELAPARLDWLFTAYPDASYILELKDTATAVGAAQSAQAVRVLVDTIGRHHMEGRVVVASFDDSVTTELARLTGDSLPTVAASNDVLLMAILSSLGLDTFIVPRYDALFLPLRDRIYPAQRAIIERLPGFLSSTFTEYDPSTDTWYTKVMTPRMVRAARRHNLAIHCWTINDPADMEALIAMGVDGIVTDRPDLLDSIIARMP